MAPLPHPAADKLGHAWLALTIVLALHVADEAAHDFLALYNPTVVALRERLPFIPLPTFTFPVWLGGLTVAVLALLALSSAARRGQRWVRQAAFPYAAVMFLNGVGHIAGSIYCGSTIIAGTWTAPLLLLASAWLWSNARRSSAAAHATAVP